MENTELKNRFVLEENFEEIDEKIIDKETMNDETISKETISNETISKEIKEKISDHLKKGVNNKFEYCSEDIIEDINKKVCEFCAGDLVEFENKNHSENEEENENQSENHCENEEEKNNEDFGLIKNCDFLKKIFYNLYFKCTDIQFWYQNNREKVLEYVSTIIFAGILFTLVTLFIKMYLNLICY